MSLPAHVIRPVCAWAMILIAVVGEGCAVEGESDDQRSPLGYEATGVEVDIASERGSVFLKGDELHPLGDGDGWMLQGTVSVVIRGMGGLRVRSEQVLYREKSMTIEFRDGVRAVFALESGEHEDGTSDAL